MSLRRQLALLSVTSSLVVSACSGLRLSPVTAQPTSQWIPVAIIADPTGAEVAIQKWPIGDAGTGGD